MRNVQKLNSAGRAIDHSRDVFTWAIGTTSVAPKVSDALTLSPLGTGGGGRIWPPSQKSQLVIG